MKIYNEQNMLQTVNFFQYETGFCRLPPALCGSYSVLQVPLTPFFFLYVVEDFFFFIIFVRWECEYFSQGIWNRVSFLVCKIGFAFHGFVLHGLFTACLPCATCLEITAE